MGIPKFYRWLSERYPLVNQTIGSGAVPEFDNLYLDMNGIIHNCTHGNDPNMKLTEEQMFVKVFGYLEKLFDIVKPQKLLFMAVDGVAPRAKMNQQRSRRFKTKKAAIEAMEEAIKRGEPPPETEPFDSNCITPGTEFMARLTNHVRFFIRKKLSEDPDWQKPIIVLSGPDVPGEGEHKIMEYIRWQKRQPDYQPNERHCMYGLDADLVMLSLVTHEPHFCLLREVVSYTGGNMGKPIRDVLDNPCKEHFILFQIGLLREYMEAEFRSDSLGFAYDVERVVDDFVLFCMLVGNDFLPALPTLDIGEGGLDVLFRLYKQLLPQWGGYLTHAGELSHKRVEQLLARLADMELEVLQQRAEDAEYFENKRAARRGGGGDAYTPPAAREQPPAAAPAAPATPTASDRGGADELDEGDKLDAGIAALALEDRKELEILAVAEGEPLEPTAEASALAAVEPTMMSREARQMFLAGEGTVALDYWRSRYYRDKLGIQAGDAAGARRVVQAYIEGLHWVLEYYYRGVASWTWFYPFHYAPLASDLVRLDEVQVAFDRGEPFLPFEQLLGVLPAASGTLLPEAYRRLMTDPSSPILDFYPTQFAVDLEGKRADWEGVVLIPFIDEQRLLAASRSVDSKQLTKEERERNRLGDMAIFRYKEGATEKKHCTSTLPSHYPSVVRANSVLVLQPPPPPLPDGERGFVPELAPGTKVGSCAGFPSLKSLPHTASLKAAGINVFGMASKKESLVIKIQDVRDAMTGSLPLEQVAQAILGERCWIKWPYLQEALVQAVSNRQQAVNRDGGPPAPHPAERATEWEQLAGQLARDLLGKEGIDPGHVDLLVHCRPVEGLIRQLDGTIEKRFAKKEVVYPLQLTLRRCPAPDMRLDPTAVSKRLLEYDFKEGMRAIWLGRSNYGCVASVMAVPHLGLNKKGEKVVPPPGMTALRVEVVPAPPSTMTVQQTARRMLTVHQERYMAAGHLARKLGVSPRGLGRLTGNLWVTSTEGRSDVGICVKVASKGLLVPDFVRPLPDGKGWEYSESLVRVLEQYKAQFPWVISMVDGDPEASTYDIRVVLPTMAADGARAELDRLTKWLKKLPATRRPLVKMSTKLAPEMAVRTFQANLPPPFSKRLAPVEVENVAPCFLLPPVERGGLSTVLAGGAFEIGDRVVSVRGSEEPPFGSRGTVVGVYDDACEVLFDAEFVGGNDLYGRCDGPRGLIMPKEQLLNTSKPQAIPVSGASAPKVVRSRNAAASPGGAQPGEQPPSKGAFRPTKLPPDGSSGGNLSELLGGAGSARDKPSWFRKKDPADKAPPKPTYQPRLPDGTKGFTQGRVRRLSALVGEPPAAQGMVPAVSAAAPSAAPDASPAPAAAAPAARDLPQPAKTAAAAPKAPPPGFAPLASAVHSGAGATPKPDGAPAAVAPAQQQQPSPAATPRQLSTQLSPFDSSAPAPDQLLEAPPTLDRPPGLGSPEPPADSPTAGAGADDGASRSASAEGQQPLLATPSATPEGGVPPDLTQFLAHAAAQQQQQTMAAQQQQSMAALQQQAPQQLPPQLQSMPSQQAPPPQQLQQQGSQQGGLDLQFLLQAAQQQRQATAAAQQQQHSMAQQQQSAILQMLHQHQQAQQQQGGGNPLQSTGSIGSLGGMGPQPSVPGSAAAAASNPMLQVAAAAGGAKPPGAALLEQLQRVQQMQAVQQQQQQQRTMGQGAHLGAGLLQQLQMQQQMQQQAQQQQHNHQAQAQINQLLQLRQQSAVHQQQQQQLAAASLLQQLQMQQKQLQAARQQQQQANMNAGVNLLAQLQQQASGGPTGLEALGLGGRQMSGPVQGQGGGDLAALLRQQQALQQARHQQAQQQQMLQQQSQAPNPSALFGGTNNIWAAHQQAQQGGGGGGQGRTPPPAGGPASFAPGMWPPQPQQQQGPGRAGSAFLQQQPAAAQQQMLAASAAMRGVPQQQQGQHSGHSSLASLQDLLAGAQQQQQQRNFGGGQMPQGPGPALGPRAGSAMSGNGAQHDPHHHQQQQQQVPPNQAELWNLLAQVNKRG